MVTNSVEKNYTIPQYINELVDTNKRMKEYSPAKYMLDYLQVNYPEFKRTVGSVKFAREVLKKERGEEVDTTNIVQYFAEKRLRQLAIQDLIDYSQLLGLRTYRTYIEELDTIQYGWGNGAAMSDLPIEILAKELDLYLVLRDGTPTKPTRMIVLPANVSDDDYPDWPFCHMG